MEKVVLKDILLTNTLINSRHKNNYINQYGSFKTIYSFSNEDLNNCFNKFDFKNKSILSILGSSDQIIDMHLKGAKEIDTFDINTLTKYYYYLKKEMLSYNYPIDFYIDFLNNDNTNNPYYMNYRTFNKFQENINQDIKEYWQYIFDNYNPDEIAHGLFSMDSTDKAILKRNVNYLNSKNNYKKITNEINKLDINFINTDLRKIENNINKKYDYIYLSNIMQYVEQLYTASSYLESLYMYKKLLIQLENNLNNEGQIINYIFNYNQKIKRNCLFTVFSDENFNFNKINSTDGVLTYTKK